MKNTNWNERLFILFINDKADKHDQTNEQRKLV